MGSARAGRPPLALAVAALALAATAHVVAANAAPTGQASENLCGAEAEDALQRAQGAVKAGDYARCWAELSPITQPLLDPARRPASLSHFPASFAAVLHTAGLCLSRHGKPANAVRHLRAALEVRADTVPSLLLLGATLLQHGDAAGAEPPLARAAALQPRRGFTASLLARARVDGGDAPGAVDALMPRMVSNATAWRGDAERAEGWRTLCQALAAAGRVDEAMAACQRWGGGYAPMQSGGGVACAPVSAAEAGAAQACSFSPSAVRCAADSAACDFRHVVWDGNRDTVLYYHAGGPQPPPVVATTTPLRWAQAASPEFGGGDLAVLWRAGVQRILGGRVLSADSPPDDRCSRRAALPWVLLDVPYPSMFYHVLVETALPLALTMRHVAAEQRGAGEEWGSDPGESSAVCHTAVGGGGGDCALAPSRSLAHVPAEGALLGNATLALPKPLGALLPAFAREWLAPLRGHGGEWTDRGSEAVASGRTCLARLVAGHPWAVRDSGALRSAVRYLMAAHGVRRAHVQGWRAAQCGDKGPHCFLSLLLQRPSAAARHLLRAEEAAAAFGEGVSVALAAWRAGHCSEGASSPACRAAAAGQAVAVVDATALSPHQQLVAVAAADAFVGAHGSGWALAAALPAHAAAVIVQPWGVPEGCGVHLPALRPRPPSPGNEEDFCLTRDTFRLLPPGPVLEWSWADEAKPSDAGAGEEGEEACGWGPAGMRLRSNLTDSLCASLRPGSRELRQCRERAAAQEALARAEPERLWRSDRAIAFELLMGQHFCWPARAARRMGRRAAAVALERLEPDV